MPLGENQVNWVTEIVSGTTPVGTHLDALSHLQIGTAATTVGPSPNSPARRK
jgi:kynurenine formamidase